MQSCTHGHALKISRENSQQHNPESSMGVLAKSYPEPPQECRNNSDTKTPICEKAATKRTINNMSTLLQTCQHCSKHAHHKASPICWRSLQIKRLCSSGTNKSSAGNTASVDRAAAQTRETRNGNSGSNRNKHTQIQPTQKHPKTPPLGFPGTPDPP